MEALRHVVHFFDAFKPRMLATLLYFDNSIVLANFSRMMQVGQKELVGNFQPGLMGLLELQLVVIFLN
jgi:hypothetical protein